MREPTAELSPQQRKVLDDIAEHGLHIVHVPDDDDGPGFSFTIGLWENFEQPEIIVFGLPGEVTEELLNAIADEADDGKRFAADSKHDGLLVDYPVRFFAVPKAAYRDYLGMACWAYEGDDFPCVQFVWPDKQGRWPWDEAVRDGFRDSQPVLAKQDWPV